MDVKSLLSRLNLTPFLKVKSPGYRVRVLSLAPKDFSQHDAIMVLTFLGTVAQAPPDVTHLIVQLKFGERGYAFGPVDQE